MPDFNPPKPKPQRRVAIYPTNPAALDCPRILVTVGYQWDGDKGDFYGDVYDTVKINTDPDGWKLGSYTPLNYTLVINRSGKGYLEFELTVRVTIGDLKAAVKIKYSGVTFSGPTRVLNIMVKGTLNGDNESLDAWCFVMKPGRSY